MKRINLWVSAALLAMLVAQNAAADQIGAQVLVQSWNPLSPQTQGVQIPYDNASSVSDAVLKGWEAVRDFVCGPLKSDLTQADLLKKGYTLRDIDCSLPNGSLTVAQDGAHGLKLTYQVHDAYFAATSTTPTIIGDYGDPRFSILFDLTFELGLKLQKAGDTIKITTASVAVSNAHIDSHNTIADIAKWVDDNLIDAIKGSSFRNQAEKALDKVKLDFAGRINPNLVGVNNALRGAPNLVRVGMWARANKIYVAFTPTNWLPPGTSAVSGRVFWKTSVGTFTPITSCTAFTMEADVQVGPAPLVDPITRAVGIAPTARVGRMVAGTAVAAAGDVLQCQYTLGDVPAGVPLSVTASASGVYGKTGHMPGNPLILMSMTPVNWNGQTVADGGSGRDWEMKSKTVHTPEYGATKPNILQKSQTPDPAPEQMKQASKHVTLPGQIAHPAMTPHAIEKKALSPNKLPKESVLPAATPPHAIKKKALSPDKLPGQSALPQSLPANIQAK
jgi:hypothetical protein